MSVFVHAQGIKTLHAEGGGDKKWQNSVHVVVECPLSSLRLYNLVKPYLSLLSYFRLPVA